MDDAFAHERVQSLLDFASLTDLVLPYVPEINDWKIVAEALSVCPITINAWDQLTNEGKALFKEL